mgnify:FL=1
MLKAVLWDADGVLQQVPGGWRPLLNDLIGPERTDAFLTSLWPTAMEAMRGRGDILVALDELFERQGLLDVAPRIREVWGTFDRFDDTRDLVAEVRRTGIGCHLATNQDPLRASYMRERLGYGDLMDRSFYSCDVGAAKPDPEFFERVLEALALPADEVAFVDDHADNVATARAVGLQAVHWHHDEGLPTLRAALRELGVELPETQ